MERGFQDRKFLHEWEGITEIMKDTENNLHNNERLEDYSAEACTQWA